MTLVDEHSTCREISLGYGYEEREKKRAKRERDRERSVCHGMMVVVFCCCCLFFVTVRGLFFGLLSFFTGRLACAQAHAAFPQLPQHAADSCTHAPG
jgi:hypothetical protein